MLPTIATPLRLTVLLSGLLAPDAFAGACTQEERTGGQHLVDVSGEMRVENGEAEWTRVFVFSNAEGVLTGLRIDDACYNEADIREGFQIHIDGVDDDHRALRLSAPGIDTTHGGTLRLRYLQNGIDNTYRNFNMSIRRVDEVQGATTVARWKLFTGQNETRPIRSLWMRENTFLGSLIGIDGIDPRTSKVDTQIIQPAQNTDLGILYVGGPEQREVATTKVKPITEVPAGSDAGTPGVTGPPGGVPAGSAGDWQLDLPPNLGG